jgi:hypothetical protein
MKSSETIDLSEAVAMKRADRNSKLFLDKFPRQFEALKNSPLAMVRPISAYDISALGEQFLQFEQYKDWIQEEGTAADLGKLPSLAFDIITGVYGASILPLVASIQPIEEERGTIYFKQTKATTSRGNVTAGQVLQHPMRAPDVYQVGFAGEKISAEILGVTAANITAYAGVVAVPPVRPNTFKGQIIVANNTVLNFMDDGAGNILGNGVSGTIVYATGAYTLNFNVAPPAGINIAADYGTDFEAAGNPSIARIAFTTDTTDVAAEIFALATEVGMFKAFSMKKRFGVVAEDEMVQDLTNEMNSELGNTAIVRLYGAAMGVTPWSKTPPTGVAWALHKLELKDVLSRQDATIQTNAGRGLVNLLIAGSQAASYLSTLPGFEKSPITASGPHFYGTLDGITVIRAPQQATWDILCIFKGTGAFDAPLAYAPYMPLFVSGTLPLPTNVLVKQSVAAVWAGMKIVAPPFITIVRITQ